jgi:hypothetical protein
LILNIAPVAGDDRPAVADRAERAVGTDSKAGEPGRSQSVGKELENERREEGAAVFRRTTSARTDTEQTERATDARKMAKAKGYLPQPSGRQPPLERMLQNWAHNRQDALARATDGRGVLIWIERFVGGRFEQMDEGWEATGDQRSTFTRRSVIDGNRTGREDHPATKVLASFEDAAGNQATERGHPTHGQRNHRPEKRRDEDLPATDDGRRFKRQHNDHLRPTDSR